MERLDMLPRQAKKTLLKDIKKLHQFKVCDVVGDIKTYSAELKIDQANTLQQYKDLEETKEQILENSRAELSQLMDQKEILVDDKRELEFEII